MMLYLRREQGRLAELEPAIRAFGEQYGAIPGWRAALAHVLAELGQEAEARREFEVLAADGFTGLPRDMAWLVSVTALSETCAALRDARRAAMLYELLLPYADRAIVAVACYGAAARNLGVLATILGRWTEAARHFEQALDLNRRMGARPWVARTRRCRLT
jgi:tetratricopeptide (TPR) repeat protein